MLSAVSSVPGSHTNPEPSCVTHNGARVLAVQENNQTQCRSSGAVVDCGSAEGKVIGDFGINAAGESGAVVASVQNTEGKKTRAGNTSRELKSVAVQSLEDSDEEYRPGSCDKTFLFGSGNLQHGKGCRSQNKFQCLECNMTFRNKRDLVRHEESKNLAGKMYHCDRCTQRFCLTRDLSRHEIRIHNHKRIFNCKWCHRQYVSESTLNVHQVVHSELKCICPVCHKRFRDKYALKRHSYTHKDVKNFGCSQCDRYFKSKGTLNKHLRRCHPVEYAATRSKRKNRKEDERVTVNPVSTHEAGISNILKQQQTLDQERSFKCEERPDQYIHKHSVTRHEREAHYAGDPCAVSRRHKKISGPAGNQVDDNGKPFSCVQCSNRYKHKSSLDRHIRIHDSNKSYACGVCNRSFATAYLLQQHRYTHINSKTIKCPYCSVFSQSPDSLRKHKKRYHSDKQEKSTKTNNNGSKEINVNPVSKYQKGISKDSGKQNAEGDLVADQWFPVIEQPSTSGSYIDESRLEPECDDSQMQEWSGIVTGWQIGESDNLCEDVSFDVDSEAIFDFNGECIADFSDELLIGDI